eukprot:COSAG05_NODE_10086_length_583_cov_8.665289_2_plen_34_part_01
MTTLQSDDHFEFLLLPETYNSEYAQLIATTPTAL